MIYLVTGTPGAGKTLRTVELVIAWLKEGKTVFTNINGLNAPGDLRQFDGYLDWTDTPDGSVVVYDEAQQHFGADGGRGRSDRKDIEALEVHRHTGHTIVFITQHPRLLHSHVTRLVGRHEHIARMFGTSNTYKYWLDRLMNVDSKSDLKFAQLDSWRYPSHLFQHYKSSSLHVNNRRIPKRIWIMLFCGVSLMSLIGILLYNLYHSPQLAVLMGNKAAQLEQQNRLLGGVASGEVSPQDAAASVGSPSPPAAVAPARPDVDYPAQDWAAERVEMTPVMGCIASHNPAKPRCTCYTPRMTPILMPTSECLSRIQDPLPRSLESRQGGQREGAQGRAPDSDRRSAATRPVARPAVAQGLPDIPDRPWPSTTGYSAP